MECRLCAHPSTHKHGKAPNGSQRYFCPYCKQMCWVHKLTHVLNQALGYEKQLPERDPHRLEAVLTRCPSLKFIIDGTERRINRPKDKAERKEYYSGKKKTFTVKNNLITQRGGKVLFLERYLRGQEA